MKLRHRWRVPLALILLNLLVGLTASCGGDDDRNRKKGVCQRCNSTADCRGRLVCDRFSDGTKRCVHPASLFQTCPSASVLGVIEGPSFLLKDCTSTNDCQGGLVCEEFIDNQKRCVLRTGAVDQRVGSVLSTPNP